MTLDVALGLPARDETGAIVFRARVATQLAGDWARRSNALLLCGRAGVQLRCECGQAHIVPYRCGGRSCPTCAPIRAAQTVERIANRVAVATAARQIDDLWDGKGLPRARSWRMLTATLRAADERWELPVMRRSVIRVRRAWGRFWRSTPWGARVRGWRTWETAAGPVRRRTARARRDTAATMGVEVAPKGMVHLHAAIYGEYVASAELGRLWSLALGESAFVKVRSMRAAGPEDFKKALREVLKYVTKFDKGAQREARAATIELAMQGVRRVEMTGFIRAMPGVDALVAKPDPDACSGCGQTASKVRWVGIRDPEWVVQHGGFGPLDPMSDPVRRRKIFRDLSHSNQGADDGSDGPVGAA